MGKHHKPILRIRSIREAKGYTQEYMAEMLDICQSTYANLESGKSSMSIERLIAIAEILETDLFDLVEAHSVQKASTAPLQESIIPMDTFKEPKAVYYQMIVNLQQEIAFLRGLVRKA